MIKLRIFGIDTVFTFGFFLVISMLSLWRSPSVGVMAVSACIIHELGHCFMSVILNVKLVGVKFWAGGVLIKKEKRIIPFPYELSILLCGPVFNLIFSMFYAVGGRYDAAVLNAVFALFNMLPFRTLDGGSILALCLERRMRFGGEVQRIVCTALGIAVILFMLATGTGSAVTIAAIAILTLNEAIG